MPCNSRKFQQNLWEVLGPEVSWQSSPIFPWTESALAPPPQVVTGREQPMEGTHQCRHNGAVCSSHQVSVSSAIYTTLSQPSTPTEQERKDNQTSEWSQARTERSHTWKAGSCRNSNLPPVGTWDSHLTSAQGLGVTTS